MGNPILPAVSPAPGQANNYEYDVFLSYTHDTPFGPWVRETFFDVFEAWLRQALQGQKPKIFFDTSSIASGTAWPLVIRRGLATSRCLVAVWSPDYFVSKWCVRECCVMLQREKQLGYRTLENPSGLILPVQVYDRNHFPEAVRSFVAETQALDCRDYANPAPMYKQTLRYVELIELIRVWTQRVAQVIYAAPPWRPEWLTPEWLESRPLACEETLRPPEPHFPAPSLARP
jgi:hypothetical protein